MPTVYTTLKEKFKNNRLCVVLDIDNTLIHAKFDDSISLDQFKEMEYTIKREECEKNQDLISVITMPNPNNT